MYKSCVHTIIYFNYWQRESLEMDFYLTFTHNFSLEIPLLTLKIDIHCFQERENNCEN